MKIAIIEDHQVLSQSVQQALERQKTNEVRVFIDAESFLATAANIWQPDIAICDIMLPGDMDGLAMIEKAKALPGSTCKFIVLTGTMELYYVRKAMAQGINVVLTKDLPLDDLEIAINKAEKDEQYVNSSLRDRLVKDIFNTEKDEPLHLSPRETDVLGRICGGATPKEIAYELKLSTFTVQQYIKTLMSKFKVNRTTDLVLSAIKKGLGRPPTE